MHSTNGKPEYIRIGTIVVIAVDFYEQYRWPRLSYDTNYSRGLTDSLRTCLLYRYTRSFMLDHVFFVLVNFWNYNLIKTLLLMHDIHHLCLQSSTPSVPWRMSPFKLSFKEKKYRSNVRLMQIWCVPYIRDHKLSYILIVLWIWCEVEGKPYVRNWVTTQRAHTKR